VTLLRPQPRHGPQSPEIILIILLGDLRHVRALRRKRRRQPAAVRLQPTESPLTQLLQTWEELPGFYTPSSRRTFEKALSRSQLGGCVAREHAPWRSEDEGGLGGRGTV
jgi:hypothetical protein